MTAEPFSVQAADDEARRTIAVRGEVDLATAPELMSAICDSPSLLNVRVDLSDVTFMDSTGLNTLVQSKQKLNAAGLDMEIVNATPVVAKVIAISGLGEYLEAPQTKG